MLYAISREQRPLPTSGGRLATRNRDALVTSQIEPSNAKSRVDLHVSMQTAVESNALWARNVARSTRRTPPQRHRTRSTFRARMDRATTKSGRSRRGKDPVSKARNKSICTNQRAAGTHEKSTTIRCVGALRAQKKRWYRCVYPARHRGRCKLCVIRIRRSRNNS